MKTSAALALCAVLSAHALPQGSSGFLNGKAGATQMSQPFNSMLDSWTKISKRTADPPQGSPSFLGEESAATQMSRPFTGMLDSWTKITKRTANPPQDSPGFLGGQSAATQMSRPFTGMLDSWTKITKRTPNPPQSTGLPLPTPASLYKPAVSNLPGQAPPTVMTRQAPTPAAPAAAPAAPVPAAAPAPGGEKPASTATTAASTTPDPKAETAEKTATGGTTPVAAGGQTSTPTSTGTASNTTAAVTGGKTEVTEFASSDEACNAEGAPCKGQADWTFKGKVQISNLNVRGGPVAIGQQKGEPSGGGMVGQMRFEFDDQSLVDMPVKGTCSIALTYADDWDPKSGESAMSFGQCSQPGVTAAWVSNGADGTGYVKFGRLFMEQCFVSNYGGNLFFKSFGWQTGLSPGIQEANLPSASLYYQFGAFEENLKEIEDACAKKDGVTLGTKPDKPSGKPDAPLNGDLLNMPKEGEDPNVSAIGGPADLSGDTLASTVTSNSTVSTNATSTPAPVTPTAEAPAPITAGQ
ncbi:Hypothetical protein D9617_20g028270 [Elsinoe fawcettii]|nr:Hypothetical protein D9617_20g028270 [Elsinoe fawcettii]